MRKNNKGFTLVELIVTIVLLSLLAGIGTYSVISIINKSKLENYNLLITNIRSAAESYYQECKYSKETIRSMFDNDDNANNFCKNYTVTLGNLVNYGYLKGNKKVTSGTNKDKYTIENPLTGDSISNCKIKITYNSDSSMVVTTQNSLTGCPTNADYSSGATDYSLYVPSTSDSTNQTSNETNGTSNETTNDNTNDNSKDESNKESKETSKDDNDATIGGSDDMSQPIIESKKNS